MEDLDSSIPAIAVEQTGRRSMLDSTSSDDRGSVGTVVLAPGQRGGSQDQESRDLDARHTDADVEQRPQMGVSYIDDDPSDGESFDDEEDEDVRADPPTTSPVLAPLEVSASNPSTDPSSEAYVYATPKPRPPSSPLPASSSSSLEGEDPGHQSSGDRYPVEVVTQPSMAAVVKEEEQEVAGEGAGLRDQGFVGQVVSPPEMVVSSPGNFYEEPGEGCSQMHTGNTRPALRPPLPPASDQPPMAAEEIDDQDVHETTPLDPTLNPPMMQNGTKVVKRVKENKPLVNTGRSSMCGVLSFTYALVLVVSGVVLTTGLTSGSVQKGPEVRLPVDEWFLIYLALMSILLLVYVCLCMKSRHSTDPSDSRKSSSDNQKSNPPTAASPPTLENSIVDHYSVVKGQEGSLLRQWTKRNCNSRVQSTSFYLRLSAAVLGIMSMVQASLELGELLDFGKDGSTAPLASIVRSIAMLLFTFVQLYTILLGAKTSMPGACLPLFSYSHLAATNIVVLIRTTVVETVRDLSTRPLTSTTPTTSAQTTTTAAAISQFTTTLNISRTMELRADDQTNGSTWKIMTRVMKESSPYLYTYQMQYSIIVTGVLIAMWLRVNSRKDQNESCEMNRRSMLSRPLSIVESDEPECVSMPNYGLLLGLIALIGVLVTTVVYFVLVNDDHHLRYAVTSSLMLSSVELLLAVCSLTSVVIGAAVWPRCRGRDDGHVTYWFDDALMAFSLGGVLLFEGMRIISLFYLDLDYLKYFELSSCLSIILQAVVQCSCIRVWLRQCRYNTSGSKPRLVIRQCVAFLLLVNIAFYILTVCVQQTRTEHSSLGLSIRNFFGDFSIAAITRTLISNLSPLFRLSSVVCLAHLWNRLGSVPA